MSFPSHPSFLIPIHHRNSPRHYSLAHMAPTSEVVNVADTLHVVRCSATMCYILEAILVLEKHYG